MDRKLLVALLSSVISEIVLLLLFTSPTSLSPLLNPNPSSPPPFPHLFLHLLNSSEIAATISLLSHQKPQPSKKRKRLTFDQEQESEPESDEEPTEGIAENGDENFDRSRFVRLPDPNSFHLFFRMTSVTFEWLSGLLEPLLECRDPVGSALNLSAGIRLGIGLFRLATGSGYADIARRFAVAESTARFCTKQLCRVLCTNFRFWVAFPNPSELRSVSEDFETLSGLPNCCGVIDCTRFKILKDKPSPENDFSGDFFGGFSNSDVGDQEESVVAQIVVDSSSRILSIITGFHGDKGDSRVLRSSTFYKDVEEGKVMNLPPVYLKGVSIPQYLVGDAGYPFLPWLMVPFVDPVFASYEENFNAVHCSMRQPALRSLASLRNWGILDSPIEEETKMAVACIGACAILHNVLLMREDYSALSDGEMDYSLLDESSQYYRDASLEEFLIEKKASIVRSALAAKAGEVHSSTQLVCR